MPMSIDHHLSTLSNKIIGGEGNIHYDRWSRRGFEKKILSCCPRVGQSRHLMEMPLLEQ